MLIRVGDNSYTGVNRYKNKYWVESPHTPNEAYQANPRYKRIVDLFKREHKITGPTKFFEVRIIHQMTSIAMSSRWWDQPAFMDRVFWVFMQPEYTYGTGEPYGWYSLEPMECMRVVSAYEMATGNKLTDEEKRKCAYVVPVECVQIAWTETANGTSEHLHHREEIPKPQQQVDKEAKRAEDAVKIIEMAEDFSTTLPAKKLLGDVKKAEEKLSELSQIKG